METSEAEMRLYPVKVVESYQRLNRDYEDEIVKMRKLKEANDRAYSDLAEQLRQEQENHERCQKWNKFKDGQIEANANTIIAYIDKIQALELRLKHKDSPIKAGLKRAWKWFKGLVGK